MAENTLFDLVGEYKALYALLTDTDEESRQVVEDTLEAVKGEIEVKASGYVAIMNQLAMEEEACKKQRDEWDARYKARKNGRERLKKHFLDGMLILGLNEINANGVTVKVANAGGVLPIVYDASKTVPEKYTKVTIETDGKLVREALDRGEKLDFAHFGERGKVLKVK